MTLSHTHVCGHDVLAVLEGTPEIVRFSKMKWADVVRPLRRKNEF